MSQRSARRTQAAGRSVGPGELAKLQAARKSAAGSVIDSVAPSTAAVRAAVEEGQCPFCGSGPWKMVAVHTNKVHGVDKWELRDMAGLTTSDPLCDADTRRKMRAAALRNPDAVSRATTASNQPGVKKNPRQTKAGRERKQANIAGWAERNPEEMARLRGEFRDRMTSPESMAKWTEAMVRVRAEREYTDEERRAFRERMAAPDVEARRRQRRDETKTETCSEDGCDRPHAARGLCRMHWRRWRSKQNRRTRCTVCHGPLDAQRATRKYCSAACKSRAARG